MDIKVDLKIVNLSSESSSLGEVYSPNFVYNLCINLIMIRKPTNNARGGDLI